jgi:hypothetical protein
MFVKRVHLYAIYVHIRLITDSYCILEGLKYNKESVISFSRAESEIRNYSAILNSSVIREIGTPQLSGISEQFTESTLTIQRLYTRLT